MGIEQGDGAISKVEDFSKGSGHSVKGEAFLGKKTFSGGSGSSAAILWLLIHSRAS